MQRRALLFDHLISAGEQVPVLGSHSSDRSQVRWLAPPAEMIDPCLIQGPCHLGPWRSRIFLISPPLISCFRGPPLVSVIDPYVTSSFTPSPNSGTAARPRQSRRDTQVGARSSESSPTRRQAPQKDRRLRAPRRSPPPPRRATRRG